MGYLKERNVRDSFRDYLNMPINIKVQTEAVIMKMILKRYAIDSFRNYTNMPINIKVQTRSSDNTRYTVRKRDSNSHENSFLSSFW